VLLFSLLQVASHDSMEQQDEQVQRVI